MGGVPGVDWEQLGGKCSSISRRFEQFQYCLHSTESVKELGGWFGANFLPFGIFLIIFNLELLVV